MPFALRELVEQERARDALALWRGEALADIADEPFAASEIRRLEQLRLRAAELAIDADLAAGRHGGVIAELEALVAQHPLRERLHAQRMLALYRAGRQSEALEAYRTARAALVEQVGVEPGAELRRLQAAILAQDPALDAAAPPPASEARPPPRRRFFRGIVATALLMLAGLAAFGISRVTQPDGLPRIDEEAVGAIDPGTGLITAQYQVGRGPGAIAVGGGSVWVANTLDGTVTRIDREAGEVVTIPVGGVPSGLAFGAGSLWVADGGARAVAQVDPRANKVLQRIDVANAPRGVAIAGSALWIVTGVDGAVHRIALDRTTPRRSIPIGANPTAIAAGAGAVWVASEEAGTVTRVDPRSGAVVQAINVGNGPSAVATGERAVWVSADMAERSRGSTQRPTPCHGRSGPGAIRLPSRSAQAGYGSPGERRAPSSAWTHPPLACSRPSKREAAPPPSPPPAARYGPPRSRRRPATVAARCDCSSLAATLRTPSRSTGSTRGLTHTTR